VSVMEPYTRGLDADADPSTGEASLEPGVEVATAGADVKVWKVVGVAMFVSSVQEVEVVRGTSEPRRLYEPDAYAPDAGVAASAGGALGTRVTPRVGAKVASGLKPPVREPARLAMMLPSGPRGRPALIVGKGAP